VAYLDQVQAQISQQMRGSPPPVTVLGFSQGVATATRWVTRGAVEPVRLVLWGDFTPPDLNLERATIALADVDVVMVRGDEDAALAPELASAEAARLAGANIRYRTQTYRGGHEIDPAALQALVEAR